MVEAQVKQGVNTRKTILVVDDDRDLNDLLCALLEDSGYDTIPALDGETALGIMKERRPDLVLLDYILPDVNGVEFFKKAHKEELMREIPIIMISGKTDVQTKIASFSAGARRYLSKPFENKDLLGEIGKTLIQQERSRIAKRYHDEFGSSGDFGNFDFPAIPENKK